MPKRPLAATGKRAPGTADTLRRKNRRHGLHQSKKLRLDQADGSSQPELSGPSSSLASPTRHSASNSDDASPSKREVNKLHAPEARKPEQKGQIVEPPHVSEPKNASNNAPVLAWMRVPIEIEAGGGLALSLVKGIDPRLVEALYKCELLPCYL